MIVNKQNKENNLTTFVIKVFDKKYSYILTAIHVNIFSDLAVNLSLTVSH